MNTVTIVYRNTLKGYDGSVICPEDAWRSEAAYYLTLPGYVLVRAHASVTCPTCQGAGVVKPPRKRKPVPVWMMNPCPTCQRQGSVRSILLDVQDVTVDEYVRL